MMAHAAVDRVLSESEVLSIVRRHKPAATALTGVDESGRKGRAYFVDGDVVLKTHRPARLRGRLVEEFETSLEKEAFFLGQLQSHAIGETPRPLGHGHDLGVDYVCMTRVPGISMRRLELTGRERSAALASLGRLLARIHSIAQDEITSCGLFPTDGDAGALRERMGALLEAVADAVNGLPRGERLSRDAHAIAEAALKLLPAEVEPVAVHSNPAPEHVYVEPSSGEVIGLIDFGDAFISHPAFDMRPWRSRADRDVLVAGYREVRMVDEAFLATMRAGMVLGELANVTRGRRPVAESEDIIEDLLRW
jgi:Ser/Thr protein kinase RdoA (MazF antagonist)